MMKIRHEAQLLKSQSRQLEDSVKLELDQLVDYYTLNCGRLGSIEYLASCPATSLLAAYIEKSTQIVILDTKSYAKRDRFLLKACKDKFSRRSFTVKGVSFSPDGIRLAVGQSDCIIYLYKLFQHSVGQEGLVSTKATITGKFVCSSPIACLLWTEFGIIFGAQDGKIKLIATTTMKTAPAPTLGPDNQSSSQSSTRVVSLYVAPKAAMPLSLAFRTHLLVISFIDCSVAVATLTEDLVKSCTESNQDSMKRQSVSGSVIFSLFEHTCPAYHLAVMHNDTVCCGGNDGKLFLIKQNSSNGFDTLQRINLKEEVTALQYSEINEVLAVATVTRLLFVKYDQETSSWQLQNSYIELQKSAITSLSWLRDGSHLALGCVNGSLELFQCSWNNQSVGDQVEICHIAKNRVRITDKERNLLATYKSRYNIKRVNLIDKGLSVIIWTGGSLLLARMSQPSLKSEVQWPNREKNLQFCFDHPGFVLIFNRVLSQLNLVRLGEDSIVFCDKVSRVCRETISVRKYPSRNNEDLTQLTLTDLSQQTTSGSNRSKQASITDQETYLVETQYEGGELISVREKLAYLMEANQLVVVDLMSGGKKEIQESHSSSITMISINYTCTSLIYLDSQKELFLFNFNEPDKAKSIMRNCLFCQWFNNSDILIAQKKYMINIWYDIREKKKLDKIDTRSYNITNNPPIVDLSFAANKSSSAFPLVVKAIRHESTDECYLQLSNGGKVTMDNVKSKFYSTLVKDFKNKLEDLLVILEQEDPQTKESALWDKLGWLALEQNNCDIAIRVFDKLQHKSMVKYLKETMKNSETLECQLSLLRGDWETFETISDAEKVASVYRKLNKWSKLIEYYANTQRFRQRDLAELDFINWLKKQGRHFEAAQIQARNGDLCSALEMLMENKKFTDAVNLLIKNKKTFTRTRSNGLTSSQDRLIELCQKLEQELVADLKYKDAALVNDNILGRVSQAFELYVKAEDYESALELAKLSSEKSIMDVARVKECQLLLGDRLLHQYRNKQLPRRLASAAVNHYKEAGEIVRALEAALELCQYNMAYEIVVENKEMILKEDVEGEKGGAARRAAAKVGEHLLCQGSFEEEAVEAYLIGGMEQKVIELYLKGNKYEKAYEIMLSRLNNGDEQKAKDEFMKLALKKRHQGLYKEAEQIYLMLQNWPAAIEMHKLDTKDYERMLDLIEKYQPDEMEANLLLLARNLESCGELERAESYLLRASDSEWVNVVRMYRIAGRWEDAFRVAQGHCASPRDPLLIQLAYWWARSFDKNELAQAKRLLVDQLGLFEQVIEFSCENKNFQFAIDLSREEMGGRGRSQRHETLIRRYAGYLESEDKFKAAEELLVEWGLVEEAASMYIDNDMVQDAIAMAERCLVSVSEAEADAESAEDGRGQVAYEELMKRVLVRCANKLDEQTSGRQQQHQRQQRQVVRKYDDEEEEDERRLSQAQQMYLRAQRPELAVALYRKRGRWQEAIQVAQRFAPHLLEALERDLDSELSDEVLEVTGNMMIYSGVKKEATAAATTTTTTVNKGFLPRTPQTTQVVASSTSSIEIQDKLKMSTRAGNHEASRDALNKFLDSLLDG